MFIRKKHTHPYVSQARNQSVSPKHPSSQLYSTHPYPTPKKPKHSTHPSVRIHTSYRIKHRQNRIAHPSVSTHPYPTSDRITHRQNQDILADRPYTMHACMHITYHTYSHPFSVRISGLHLQTID